MRARLARSSDKLDRHARALTPLSVGDCVLLQNQHGPHPTKWDRSGTIVELGRNDQYLVKVVGSGRVTLRNRRFLRRYTPLSTTIGVPLRHSDDVARQAPLRDTCGAATPLPSSLAASAPPPPAHIPVLPVSPAAAQPSPQPRSPSHATPGPTSLPTTPTTALSTEDVVPAEAPAGLVVPIAAPQDPQVRRSRRQPQQRRRYVPETGTWEPWA